MKTVNEKIIKTFELLELVSINDYEKFEIRFKTTGEVLSREDDYDRACEEFEGWKHYYY